MHVQVDDTTIRVATTGSGPPLVLVNGFGANIEMWGPFPSLLTGRRIVMFDAPGTGESPPLPRWRRMGALAELLGRLLDTLGIVETDVLGYSWGGALAQQFAHQAGDRVRSLVLVSTIYGVGALPPSLWALGNMLTPRRYYSSRHLEKIAPRLYGGVTRRNPAAVRIQAQARIERPPSAIGYTNQMCAIAGWTSAPWLWSLRPRSLVLVGDDDPLVATTSTDKSGRYTFRPVPSGIYWVAVDEESFTPAGSVTGLVRAEQTFGGNGALCQQLDGSIVRRTGAGPCFGGRSMTPDDPSHLSASRHVAAVAFGAGSVSEVDFGFSFNAVTSTADALGSGTLRQFVANANAIRGANTMRFVPVTHAPNGKWWSIRLASPLPALIDAGTTIDGTAYSIVDPKYAIDSNKEVLIRSSNHVVTGRPIVGPERPELEVTLNGDRGIDAVTPAAIRNIAIGGARTNVVAHATLAIEGVAIGVHPDGNVLRPAGEEGVVIESGSTHVDGLFISAQSNIGLAVRPGAALTARGLIVTRCGVENNGAGVLLASSDAAIAESFIFDNDSAAVVIGGNETAPAARNAIRGSTVSHNRAGIVLSQNAIGAIVEQNDIVWNSEGGVVTNPSPKAPARLTRISHNHFNENGGVPIDLQHQTEKLRIPPAACRAAGMADDGLGAPQVTRAEWRSLGKNQRELIVEGKACPGATVELYESFVTGELRTPLERERQARDLPSVREAVRRNTVESRDSAGGQAVDIIPSVGEFNFALTVQADASGNFKATFSPLLLGSPTFIPFLENELADPPVKHRQNLGENSVEMDMHDAFQGRITIAVAAIAIDAEGNTSEFGRRRLVGTRGDNKNAR